MAGGSRKKAGADAAQDVGAVESKALVPKAIRMDAGLADEIQGLADVRNMSFSAVVRAASEMYLAREQFAVELQNVEANLSKTMLTVLRETGRTADDVQLLIAYLDQLTKFLMMALPEVVDKEGAVALGSRRHAGFIADFHKSFNSRRRKSTLSQELDALGNEG